MALKSEQEEFAIRLRENAAAPLDDEAERSRLRIRKLNADKDRAEAEARRARNEAETLRVRLAAAKPSKVRKLLIVLAVVTMTASVIKTAYWGYGLWSEPEDTKQPATAAQSNTAAPSSPAPVVAAIPEKVPDTPGEQFKQSMSRLQDDFAGLGEDRAEVVKQINLKHKGDPKPCPIEWANGVTAVSLEATDRQPSRPLISVVNQCAAAVEEYRAQKEPTPK